VSKDRLSEVEGQHRGSIDDLEVVDFPSLELYSPQPGRDWLLPAQPISISVIILTTLRRWMLNDLHKIGLERGSTAGFGYMVWAVYLEYIDHSPLFPPFSLGISVVVSIPSFPAGPCS
jgi:hypothetical protein